MDQSAPQPIASPAPTQARPRRVRRIVRNVLIGIVAVINVINLIDGVDGLAAGVCVISAASLSVIAPTPEWSTRTLISSVDSRLSAWTMASTEPWTSALITSGNSMVVEAWLANMFSRLTGADVVRLRSSTPWR